MSDPRPITQRLKEDNWDLHQVAERDALPALMVSGTLPLETYKEMLGQMLLVNRTLDAHIRKHRADIPILAELATDEQLQEQYLTADLNHLGADIDSLSPLGATQALIDHIEACSSDRPIRLFGLHYVREGANNGNRFVAKKLRKAYGWEDAAGSSYLDPYGDTQRPKWDAFKERLATFELSEDDKTDIVATARSMFEHIIAVNKAIIEHTSADLPEVTAPPAHAH